MLIYKIALHKARWRGYIFVMNAPVNTTNNYNNEFISTGGNRTAVEQTIARRSPINAYAAFGPVSQSQGEGLVNEVRLQHSGRSRLNVSTVRSSTYVVQDTGQGMSASRQTSTSRNQNNNPTSSAMAVHASRMLDQRGAQGTGKGVSFDFIIFPHTFQTLVNAYMFTTEEFQDVTMTLRRARLVGTFTLHRPSEAPVWEDIDHTIRHAALDAQISFPNLNDMDAPTTSARTSWRLLKCIVSRAQGHEGLLMLKEHTLSDSQFTIHSLQNSLMRKAKNWTSGRIMLLFAPRFGDVVGPPSALRDAGFIASDAYDLIDDVNAFHKCFANRVSREALRNVKPTINIQALEKLRSAVTCIDMNCLDRASSASASGEVDDSLDADQQLEAESSSIDIPLARVPPPPSTASMVLPAPAHISHGGTDASTSLNTPEIQSSREGRPGQSSRISRGSTPVTISRPRTGGPVSPPIEISSDSSEGDSDENSPLQIALRESLTEYEIERIQRERNATQTSGAGPSSAARQQTQGIAGSSSSNTLVRRNNVPHASTSRSQPQTSSSSSSSGIPLIRQRSGGLTGPDIEPPAVRRRTLPNDPETYDMFREEDKNETEGLRSRIPCFIPLEETNDALAKTYMDKLSEWGDNISSRTTLESWAVTGVGENITISAPTVDAAAEVLICLVKRYMEIKFNRSTHRQAKTNFIADVARVKEQVRQKQGRRAASQVECTFQSIKILMKKKESGLTVNIGDAIGDGPRKSTVSKALELITTQPNCFEERGAYRTVQVNLFDSRDAERDICLASCGFLSTFSIITLKSPACPLSPFWALNAYDGVDGFGLDERMLIETDGTEDILEMAHAFIHWKNRASAPSEEIQRLILRCYQNPAMYTTPVDEKMYMKDSRRIALVLTLGETTVENLNMRRDFKTFSWGANFPLNPYTSVLDVCPIQDSMKGVLTHLYKSFSVDDICTKHIDTERVTREYGTDPSLETRHHFVSLEADFMRRVRRYLSGLGHPQHPKAQDIIPRDDYAKHREEKNYRLKLFLRACTGSPYIGPTERITLKFIHHTPKENESKDDFIPFGIHACFKSVDIHINECMRNFLNEPHPAPGNKDHVSDFEVVFHSQMYREVYNAI
ncbi:hypothetical protein SCHPADRAFT_896492 [Schizopora paradoxa]|uniref:Uncharacterized protein n=1 Tax=Schizopora paradoxa TaxID=27342 RepID=A0A0H2R6M5_9AGAM|nr:hypothetical protein SCHPADRAFT_896492 [Schizopora paradoxa]